MKLLVSLFRRYFYTKITNASLTAFLTFIIHQHFWNMIMLEQAKTGIKNDSGGGIGPRAGLRETNLGCNGWLKRRSECTEALNGLKEVLGVTTQITVRNEQGKWVTWYKPRPGGKLQTFCHFVQNQPCRIANGNCYRKGSEAPSVAKESDWGYDEWWSDLRSCCWHGQNTHNNNNGPCLRTRHCVSLVHLIPPRPDPVLSSAASASQLISLLKKMGRSTSTSHWVV